LGEEYKQKHRGANARKQKRQLDEPDPIGDLAKVTTLNQEAEKKKAIMLGVDGQAMLQEEEDEQDDEGEGDEPSTITMGSSTTEHGSLTHPQEQQQEEPEDTFDYDYDYLNNKPNLENIEPEDDLEEPSQSTGHEGTDDISHHNDKKGASEDDILDFEFSIVFGDIQKYMSLLHGRFDNDGKVWLSGLIDRNTGEVVHAGLGRINGEQPQG
jgi:hypothetical protein